MTTLRSTLGGLLLGIGSAAGLIAQPAADLASLRLAEGFAIEIWAEGVANARSLARSPEGTVYVGSRTAGKVYAVRDTTGDGRGDAVTVVASGLNMPNGVAFREGSLYVAEVQQVSRFDEIENRLESPPRSVVVLGGLPTERHHGWKFVRFGPDGRLYVPVGAPCNICEVEDPFAAILSVEADGSDLQVFARGVRNTVGFDWHPGTGELWFTDNGRDMMGDDVPPDELNHAPVAGLHFGFPACHGEGIQDPEQGSPAGCSGQKPPVQELAPHAGALGLRFYRGTQFPERFQGQILIAEHGSWNRKDPIGYRLSLVRLDGERALSYETIVDGWLQGKRAWGRPVDLLELPDGSILLSDDVQGVIYRLRYQG